MCGRYASTRSAAALAALFAASDATGDESLVASYNVAPTDPVHIVRRRPGPGRAVEPAERAREPELLVEVARWGLLPPWARAQRDGARMINARAETVASSPAYRGPFARRRCLVPADGWYEWLPLGGAKQAYYMTLRDGGVLAFAGLWELWRPEPVADPVLTVSIVTTAAVGELRTVHDRMPLVLSEDRWAAWLQAPGRVDAERLLAPPGPDRVAAVELRQVGPAVGNVRNNSPQLIQRVTGSALGVEPAQTADLTLF